jgi:hypothetical protein
MRWLVAILPFGFVACSYPEFAFAPSATDTGVAADTAVVDSFVPPMDSAAPDTFVALDTEMDTTMDSAIDSEMADTRDAALPDTRDAADTMPRGCAAMHDFCANFDTVTAPTTGWTGSFSNGGGAFALDNTTSVSSPNSLRVTIPTATVTASAMVHQAITITSVGTVIRVDTEMMLPAVTYSGPGNVLIFKVQRSSSGDGIAFSVGSTGPEIVAQTDATWKTWPLTGIVAGKWFHLRMDVVLHTTAGSVRAWVDDMMTPQVNQSAVVSANVDDLPRQLLVGLFAYMGASPFRVHFDDISFDVP